MNQDTQINSITNETAEKQQLMPIYVPAPIVAELGQIMRKERMNLNELLSAMVKGWKDLPTHQEEAETTLSMLSEHFTMEGIANAHPLRRQAVFERVQAAAMQYPELAQQYEITLADIAQKLL